MHRYVGVGRGGCGSERRMRCRGCGSALAALLAPNAGSYLSGTQTEQGRGIPLAQKGTEPGCRTLDLHRNPRWKVAT